MKRTFLWLSAVVIVAALGYPTFSQNPSSDTDSQAEHTAMTREHQTARAEDLKLQQTITRMKAEHCRALAVLARLQAELLDHQAELETAALHISEHDQEMAEHASEIDRHESTGDAAEHAERAARHKELMTRHAELQTSSDQLSGHHGELIDEILKLGEAHRHGLEDANREREQGN